MDGKCGEQKKGGEASSIEVDNEGVKPAGVVYSPRSSSSLRPFLNKQMSARANCLCSPTTHAGSFRCRHHRISSLTRNSNSVGSGLSDLDKKTSSPVDRRMELQIA